MPNASLWLLLSKHLLTCALFYKKLSDEHPSTSQQAAESNRDIEAPCTSPSVNRSPRQRKPFIKFKDDKYRTAQIKKYKSNLRKKTLQSSLHLPTIATPTPSQIVSRKILRTVRKRRNPLSRPNKNQSPTEATPNESFTDLAISIPNILANQLPMQTEETKEKTEDLDDDCVCIDPQPDIILIDDESTAACSIAKEDETSNQKLREYEPIGRLRTNQFKMLTSTPKLKLFSGNSPSSLPFFGDMTPMFGTVKSDSLLSGIEECTLVEKNNTNSDVVVIDDTITLNNYAVRGRKRKINTTTDDSVIFVSEQVFDTKQPTTALAYIPLITPAEESHFRIIPSSTSTPKAKQPHNDLFNSKEQKQLRQYNENAYNPNRDVPTLLTKKRMVIVDGSNVAYQHALNKEFSVKGLKICLDYFEKMGHEVKAVVPQFRLQKQKSSDPNELEKLHGEGKIVFTPCKNLPGKSSTSYDDRFVLQLASELDAAVVSNDNYRDLINENPAFKKIIENRVVGYTWCNDIFILPKDPYGKWGPALSTILNRS